MSNNERKEEREDIAELQENFNKQQAKISALKELVRKSEEAHGKSTSVTHEKVKNIAARLTNLKSIARSRQNLDRSFSELRSVPIFEEQQQHQLQQKHGSFSDLSSTDRTKARSETPGNQKIQLLREQVEKNKLKMAERENSKREIEEMVTQLKAKIDITQQSLDRSSELGRSMCDLTVLNLSAPVSGGKFKSATDISYTPLNLDKEKIKFLENRVKILEKQLDREKNTPKIESEVVKSLESKILDLQESLKEKECIIQARTQAVSLMTESLSAKGKNTVDMLEDTKQEMFKMQSNFIETEDILHAEIEQLKAEIEEKDTKIKNLEEINDILESARFDLTVKNAQFESKIQEMQDYYTKEMTKLKEQLSGNISGANISSSSEQEFDVTNQIAEEYTNIIKDLQEKIAALEKENDDLKKFAQATHDSQDTRISDDDVADNLKVLENTVQAQREEIENHYKKIQQLEDQLTEKTIEYNVLNANFSVLQEKLKASTPKSLFPTSSYDEAEAEITKLKSQLDEANKAMIKMKLKTKQLQKQVDAFSKISDVHTELIKVTEENEQLQQKIQKLEEEKVQLQMNLSSTGESTIINEGELEKKIEILETTCQNQTSAIQLLEEQKLDMTENLQTAKQELETLKDQINDREETARVVTQIETIQLEEKINDLKVKIDQLISENDKLTSIVEKLQNDNDLLRKKCDHYVAENMELLDKIEKLSKSSSSAESIEIVERLTQQEKLEIEEFNKRLTEGEHHDHNEDQVDESVESSSGPLTPPPVSDTGAAMGHELSESLTKLREESSELMHRIEMFTAERREVLEKMEILNNENQEHLNKIAKLTHEKEDIEVNLNTLKEEKIDLNERCKILEKEKSVMLQQIEENNRQKTDLIEEINTMKKENYSVSNILQKISSKNSNLYKSCENGISKLNEEVENFTKASDKSSKINSSKKLAKEAKNVCKYMREFFEEIKSTSVEMSSEIATEDVTPKDASKHFELEKLIEKLQRDLENAASKSNKKDEEINSLTQQLDTLKNYENLYKESKENETSSEGEITHLQQIRKDIELKLQASNNEIEILKALVAEQKQQLIESYETQESEMNNKLGIIEQYEREIQSLKQELDRIQQNKSDSYEKYVEQLKEKIMKLELLLNENKSLVTEQTKELMAKQGIIDSLNNEIEELSKELEENANKMMKKEKELVSMQKLLNTKQVEVENLMKESEENKKIIEKLLLELHSQTEKIARIDSFDSLQEQNCQFEARIKELEHLNSDYEMRCKEQHDRLKKFAANLKKKVTQCTEFEKKMKELDEKLEKMQTTNAKLECQEHQDFVAEIKMLKGKLNEMERHIEILNFEKHEYEQKLNENQWELKRTKNQCENYLTIIEETNIQLGDLQFLVDILHSDFNEKIKSEQYLQEKIDTIEKEKEEMVNALKNELQIKNIKFEKFKIVIKEKNREIQRLIKENEELLRKNNPIQSEGNLVENESAQIQEENSKLKDDYAKLLETYEKEKLSFQETISRLETLHDGIQAKLQEDMAYIESLETENNKFKEKTIKLEECVASFEEKRSLLEHHANLLDAQLQKKQDEYEKTEDALVYRLNMLSEHDDIIGRRLLETQEEKEELSDKLDRSRREYSDLQQKFMKLEKDFQTYQTEKYKNVEIENQSLHDRVKSLQNEISKMQTTYETKLTNKTAEIDELENDLSIQLQNVNVEKRSLQECLEKARDEIQLLKDENVRLKENCNSLEQLKSDLEREITWIRLQNENLSQDQYELQELRMQIMQDKTEIENQKHQLDTLIQNHEIEVNALKTQITELDSMRMQVSQNQTDDQVFIETENKRLKELLTEKDNIIDNYQRQNLQLQMAASSAAAVDPFASISEERSINRPGDISEEVTSTDPSNNQAELISSLQAKCNSYESEISELQDKSREKDEENSKIINDLTNLQQDFQRITTEKQREIDNLKNEVDQNRGAEQNDNVPSFLFDQPKSNIFDEIIAVRETEILSGVEDQKKIEDLEQNVSDLEKYAAELENKLKHLSHIHEETVSQLQQKTKALEAEEKVTTTQVQQLQEKQKQLNTQHSIEQFWEDSMEGGGAAELENKFKHLSHVHEETVAQLQQKTKALEAEEKVTTKQVQQLKEKQKQLNTQQNIEKIWGDSMGGGEFENKFKHLSHVHDETVAQLQQKTKALEEEEKVTTKQVQQLQEKQKQLNTQQNIEKIWGDSIEGGSAATSNTLSLKMFFDNAPDQSNNYQTFFNEEIKSPVVEEVIVPARAYLCYPEEGSNSNLQDSIIISNDDWEWGNEEAALEAKHQSIIGQQLPLFPKEQSEKLKLQEYQDRIKELELERNRLEEQKVELQVKSGRMMKKLKEYKNTIAHLNNSQSSYRKSSSVESSDLDLAIQEEMKSQITKLEEKMNEMKKQLDKDVAEKENLLKRIDVLTVANERMTEMKERSDIQLETYQTQVRQLNQKLKTLEDWSENPINPPNSSSQQSNDLLISNQEDWHRKFSEVSHELEDLKVDKDELQALLDEERENQKLNENKIQTLQAKINSLQTDLNERGNLNELKFHPLEAENQSLKSQFNDLKLKNQDLQLQLSDYESTIEQLSIESNSIRSNLELLQNEHRRKLDENSKLTNELQAWVAKSNHLSKEIEAMQKSTIDSSLEIQENHNTCKQKIVELQERLNYLENESQIKDVKITELLDEKKEWTKIKGNDHQNNEKSNPQEEQLKEEIERLKIERNELQTKIQILTNTIEELKSEKEHMENELQALNNHVIASLENEDKMKQTVLELDMKNIQIDELKKSLEILKSQQQQVEVQSSKDDNHLNQMQLEQINAQWEAIVEQRCNEVAESWRNHLAEKLNDFQYIESSLKQEIEELKRVPKNTIPDSNKEEEFEEESKEKISFEIYDKMQTALENQELEIVTLKEQLAIRSAEYARLAAQHDPYALRTTNTSDNKLLQKTSHNDQSSLVPKSELDIVLYMLHQRDMRCEELTLELVNLIEERDTLQLKLSNSLRQIEEIKNKIGFTESGPESDCGETSNTNTPQKSKSRTGNLTSEKEYLQGIEEDLNSKISQLHNVSHVKEKRVGEEKNQNQRDLNKIQEDVAKIPPEAVSELVGTDLSNTDQSPSNVLLNWLWGKTNNPQQS